MVEKILNNTTPYGKIRASNEGSLHSSTLKESYHSRCLPCCVVGTRWYVYPLYHSDSYLSVCKISTVRTQNLRFDCCLPRHPIFPVFYILIGNLIDIFLNNIS